jgi:hypothetical protein
MVTRSFEFTINRCNQTLQDIQKRPKCKSDEEINEWIKDVNVEIWGIEEKIDYSDYSDKPFYRMNTLYNSVLLNPIQIQTNYMFLSKTMFEYLDDWVPFAKR